MPFLVPALKPVVFVGNRWRESTKRKKRVSLSLLKQNDLKTSRKRSVSFKL